MGYYINPSDGSTKEQFLAKYGRKVGIEEVAITDTDLPVCLVDNGEFTAAGIMWCPQEVTAFTRPLDRRSKRFFMVPRVLLQEFL